MEKEPRGCGGHAWWVKETSDPQYVYIYGMGMPSDNTCYSVYSPPNYTSYSHNAYAKDLFDTEEEALEELIKRLNAMHSDYQSRVEGINRRIKLIEACLEKIKQRNRQRSVESWESVTKPGAVIYGSGTTRTDITVLGKGTLEIKDGATVARLSIKEGGKCIVNNGHIRNVDVYSSACLSVCNGTMSYCTIRNQADLFLTSASAYALSVRSDANVFVDDSSYVSGTLIYSGGRMSVSRAAVAQITTVSSGGKLYVSAGGALCWCHISSGGALCKERPYRVTDLTIDEGGEDHEI